MSVFFAEKITAYIKSICDDKFSFNVKKISLSTSSSITLNSTNNSKSANKNSEQQTEEIINHCLKQLTTPVATKTTSVVG